VLPEPVHLGIAQADIEIERPVNLAGPHVVLEIAERAGGAPQLDERGVVAGLGDEVDGAAQGVAAESQGVGALVDLDALGGQELQ